VPILVDIFARIGPPVPLPAAPEGVLTSRSDRLPPPLKRVGSRGSGQSAAHPVQIAYPPDGARIDLHSSDGPGAMPALVLKARGGQPPFRWVVNDQPIAAEAFARSSRWQPDGRGYARILLIDAAGAKARAQVFVD
jgi:penicillin-binding protein 1C